MSVSVVVILSSKLSFDMSGHTLLLTIGELLLHFHGNVAGTDMIIVPSGLSQFYSCPLNIGRTPHVPLFTMPTHECRPFRKIGV